MREESRERRETKKDRMGGDIMDKERGEREEMVREWSMR